MMKRLMHGAYSGIYDVQSILGDYTNFSADPERSKPLQSEGIPVSGKSLLKSDPPYHRILRGVIASAFTPMVIEKLEPRIENIAHRLINKVIEKGSMDLIKRFGLYITSHSYC